MIALNIVLMTAVAVGIVSLLTGAIVSDRRSHRAGASIRPVATPLSHDLVMPRDLRAHAARTHASSPRRRVADAAAA